MVLQNARESRDVHASLFLTFSFYRKSIFEAVHCQSELHVDMGSRKRGFDRVDQGIFIQGAELPDVDGKVRVSAVQDQHFPALKVLLKDIDIPAGGLRAPIPSDHYFFLLHAGSMVKLLS
jgi:hypothetical protein